MTILAVEGQYVVTLSVAAVVEDVDHDLAALDARVVELARQLVDRVSDAER